MSDEQYLPDRMRQRAAKDGLPVNHELGVLAAELDDALADGNPFAVLGAWARALFTVVSIVRSYALRRLFNRFPMRRPV